MGGVRIYRGIREPSCHVRVIDAAAAESPTPSAWLANGRVLTIPLELIRQDTGPFDWGADGAGAHYLAVAILANSRPELRERLRAFRDEQTRQVRENADPTRTKSPATPNIV